MKTVIIVDIVVLIFVHDNLFCNIYTVCAVPFVHVLLNRQQTIKKEEKME